MTDRPLRCIAFDCFGTLFDMSGVPKEEIANYVDHVSRDDFRPYTFPASWYRLPVHQDVVEGIRRLRANGFWIAAMSNGTPELIHAIASNAGFAFDQVVDLAKAKVYKPHKEAYREVQLQTGYKPSETLMVTANPTFGDIEGAASAGMRSQVIRHGHPNTVIELAETLGLRSMDEETLAVEAAFDGGGHAAKAVQSYIDKLKAEIERLRLTDAERQAYEREIESLREVVRFEQETTARTEERLRLTDEERKAIWTVAEAYAENDGDQECERIAGVMQGLWQRTKEIDT